MLNSAKLSHVEVVELLDMSGVVPGPGLTDIEEGDENNHVMVL